MTDAERRAARRAARAIAVSAWRMGATIGQDEENERAIVLGTHATIEGIIDRELAIADKPVKVRDLDRHLEPEDLEDGWGVATCATCGKDDVACTSNGVVWTCGECERTKPIDLTGYGR